MNYEHFVIFVRLSHMGEDGTTAMSNFTDQDMDDAIDRAIAEHVADGWEQDGPVRRDGPNAEIPIRKPGSGDLGRQQMRALAHLLLRPIPGDDGTH